MTYMNRMGWGKWEEDDDRACSPGGVGLKSRARLSLSTCIWIPSYQLLVANDTPSVTG